MLESADSTNAGVYVFRGALVGSRGVSRKLAVRGDQTLVDLHELLQTAFEWDDDHLYSFWLNRRFWDRDSGTGYARPDVCQESGHRSARIRLDRLRLEPGQSVAYLFDFGDEWRVRLKLLEIRPDRSGAVPAIFDVRGAAPPQYWSDNDEIADVA